MPMMTLASTGGAPPAAQGAAYAEFAIRPAYAGEAEGRPTAEVEAIIRATYATEGDGR